MTTLNFKVVRRELTAVSVARALYILRRERRLAADLLSATEREGLRSHIQALSAWQRRRSSVSRAACLLAVRRAAAINAELPICLQLRDLAWARRWKVAFERRDAALRERLVARGAQPL